jgi:hypothetical protein
VLHVGVGGMGQSTGINAHRRGGDQR